MNRFVLCLVLLTSLVSCHKKDTFHISGNIYGANDGDTITLAYSPDGRKLEILQQSIIKDGCFSFDGEAKECQVGYICCTSADYNFCKLFFIEKGDIVMLIDSMQWIVKGTPTNELSNVVEDSIKSYITRLEEIEEQYYSGSLSDEELEMLGASGFNLQEQLIDYIRKSVNTNIGNMLGLYMLVVYNDFFSNAELDTLIKQIPPSSIDKANNPFFNVITEIADSRKGI